MGDEKCSKEIVSQEFGIGSIIRILILGQITCSTINGYDQKTVNSKYQNYEVWSLIDWPYLPGVFSLS